MPQALSTHREHAHHAPQTLCFRRGGDAPQTLPIFHGHGGHGRVVLKRAVLGRPVVEWRPDMQAYLWLQSSGQAMSSGRVIGTREAGPGNGKALPETCLGPENKT